MAIQVYFDKKLIKQLGAYVRTDLTAVRQINGVASGITAILGLAEGGPDGEPVRILSHAEAVSVFKGGPLVDHIKSAFLGGAGEIIAVRIGNPDASALSLTLSDGTNNWTWDFSSLEKSAHANNIFVRMSVDDNDTTATDSDDKLILEVFQRNADLSTTKEVYVFPKKFQKTTVLVRRGNKLFFYRQSVIDNIVAGLPPGATNADIEAAISAALSSELMNDDNVQIFHVDAEVPMGLVFYELLIGELFSTDNSRLVSATANAVAVDHILRHPDLFNQSPLPWYDGTTNSYQYTDVALTTLTVANLIDNNATVLGNVYALSGGTNGDDGTDYYGSGTITTAPTSAQIQSWISGLQALENEEVNFVVPGYKFCSQTIMDDRETFFTVISGLVYAHVMTMSQVHMRHRRIMIVGFPAPHTDTYQKSQYLSKAIAATVSLFANSDRVQYWVHPFFSEMFAGTSELLGGEFTASYIAGKHANLFPYESITFTPFSGLGATPLYDWSYQEKDDFISNRIAFVEKIKNIFGATEYRIHHNPTTWFGPVTQGYQEFVLRRTDDYISTFLYKNLERQFIGRVSYGQRTADSIKTYTESLLSGLQNDGFVAAYRNVQVTWNEDNTVYYVEFEVQLPTEIKFILITLDVTFDLT